MADEFIDTLKDALPLIVAGATFVGWLIRLEAKGIANATRIATDTEAIKHSIGGLKQEGAEKWKFITEDRAKLGDLRVAVAEALKDIRGIIKNADDVETDLKRVKDETIPRIWTRVEDDKEECNKKFAALDKDLAYVKARAESK